jgi:DNA end-binding protein Ku
VEREEIDPRYLIRPYYLRPDGKVGHDAFAVIRETIREMNKVAIGRVVLTNREHIIALEPLEKGLVGTLLRYPYEVRSEGEYFDEIQDVKVTKDMLDLAKHIVLRRSVGGRAADAKAKSPEKAAKKPRKGAAGQKEMLMPIEGKKQAKAAPAKKTAARPQRRSA